MPSCDPHGVLAAPEPRIERVSYRSGFVERLGEASRLPAISIEPPDLHEDVLGLLDHHHLALAGTYGAPEAGDPIQYDELRIEHDHGDVEIVVCDRASCCSRPTARR